MGPYQPKFHRYTPISTTRTRAMMMVEKERLLQWPRKMRDTPAKRFSNKYCRFHKDKDHDTEECYQLKDEIERLIHQGYFNDIMAGEKKEERDQNREEKRAGREVENDARVAKKNALAKRRLLES
ncbi:UNVERIFIED_CONTAM: hypothetical protein Slati_0136600 [Sesamum latifolium]|uniref:Reverse transcriptase domain-containing protein n=1 Tax=Sesamum latifolium TaxID=2727402 RepID=A0AAW2Y9N7_9LAMI